MSGCDVPRLVAIIAIGARVGESLVKRGILEQQRHMDHGAAPHATSCDQIPATLKHDDDMDESVFLMQKLRSSVNIMSLECIADSHAI